MTTKTINVSEDFSKYPAGRLREDGDFSAQRFREEFLEPSMKDTSFDKLIIQLDGGAGYSSSFLEEAFGGLVWNAKISKDRLLAKIVLESIDRNLIAEIKQYIAEA
jgi:hypothetical protein